MRRGARNLLLALHVTASVGFVGAITAFFALALAGAFHQNAQVVRGAYISMEIITSFVILPLCSGALLTGVIQSLSTSWGLFRHYWVVVKLILTALSAALLLLHIQPITAMAKIAALSDVLSPLEYRGVRLQLIIASGGALVVGIAAIVLSIYKPQGLTRYGWRKLRTDQAPRTSSLSHP
jgi:hypothetical protein